MTDQTRPDRAGQTAPVARVSPDVAAWLDPAGTMQAAGLMQTGPAHTPGPWYQKVMNSSGTRYILSDALTEGEVIAMVPVGQLDSAEHFANACLLAAGPRLFAELDNLTLRVAQLAGMAQQAREILGRETVTAAELRDARGFLLAIEQEDTTEARAALARAEGREGGRE
jgi:hypothetical protein